VNGSERAALYRIPQAGRGEEARYWKQHREQSMVFSLSGTDSVQPDGAAIRLHKNSPDLLAEHHIQPLPPVAFKNRTERLLMRFQRVHSFCCLPKMKTGMGLCSGIELRGIYLRRPEPRKIPYRIKTKRKIHLFKIPTSVLVLCRCVEQLFCGSSEHRAAEIEAVKKRKGGVLRVASPW